MTPRVRTTVFCLATGVAGTVLAAACSLLAGGVTAKRIVWVVVTVTVAVGAGAWRGWRDGS